MRTQFLLCHSKRHTMDWCEDNVLNLQAPTVRQIDSEERMIVVQRANTGMRTDGERNTSKGNTRETILPKWPKKRRMTRSERKGYHNNECNPNHRCDLGDGPRVSSRTIYESGYPIASATKIGGGQRDGSQYPNGRWRERWIEWGAKDLLLLLSIKRAL